MSHLESIYLFPFIWKCQLLSSLSFCENFYLYNSFLISISWECSWLISLCLCTPLGVLHYLVMESVVLFSTTEDLKHASHGLVDMMELQNDAITVMTLAPMEAHIASFTMVWHSKPTIGDGEPHTPPQQTPPSGGTPHHLHVELDGLNDQELWQLIEDLTEEIVQCELTVPPSNPLQMNGYAHWALESLRRMIRRSPFQEGEGGVHWGNPLLFQKTSRRKGSLWTTPVTTMSFTGRTRHGATNYCPNIGSAHRHP